MRSSLSPEVGAPTQLKCPNVIGRDVWVREEAQELYIARGSPHEVGEVTEGGVPLQDKIGVSQGQK